MTCDLLNLCKINHFQRDTQINDAPIFVIELFLTIMKKSAEAVSDTALPQINIIKNKITLKYDEKIDFGSSHQADALRGGVCGSVSRRIHKMNVIDSSA